MTFEFIANAITGAPLWVWGVLAYLLFVGFKSMRERIVYLPKLFIIPAILFGLNYPLFIHNDRASVSAYLLSISFGLLLGFFHGSKQPVQIFKKIISIKLQGNLHTLMILLFCFFVKYVSGFIQATNPQMALEYLLFEIAIGALCSGYSLGRSLAYVYQFIRAK